MKRTLSLSLSLVSLLFVAAASAIGQTATTATPATGAAPVAAIAITSTTTPIDLARAALVAQGGEKYRNVKSMVLRGSVDLYAPNSTQSIPGGFIIVLAGEKVRMEIDARPAVSFKTIYDGQRSYSSLPGVDFPPASKFGLPLLARFDLPGYVVAAIPDEKKLRGFSIADAEGNLTNFYLDPTNGRVVKFLIPYNGYKFGTENKKLKEVDGVMIPFEFTQRLEMPQGAFFAEFKVKEAKLNQPIGDDVFAMPN
jgi:hypothetical protein